MKKKENKQVEQVGEAQQKGGEARAQTIETAKPPDVIRAACGGVEVRGGRSLSAAASYPLPKGRQEKVV